MFFLNYYVDGNTSIIKKMSNGVGGKAPVFWWILFVVGLLWFFEETTLINLEFITFTVPWLPLVVIVISLRYLINHYR